MNETINPHKTPEKENTKAEHRYIKRERQTKEDTQSWEMRRGKQKQKTPQ